MSYINTALQYRARANTPFQCGHRGQNLEGVFFMSKHQDALFRTLRSFTEKYGGVAYPSIAMLAKCTGLTELETASAIKELVEGGRITKKARYDASGRKLSNEYTIIEPKPLDNKAQNEYPKKSFIQSFKTAFKKEEDLNMQRSESKISHESHLWFWQVSRIYKLPHELFLYLLNDPHIRETLKDCKEWHIKDAVDELKYRLSIRHQIYSLGRWFNKVLETCRIKDIGIGGTA